MQDTVCSPRTKDDRRNTPSPGTLRINDVHRALGHVSHAALLDAVKKGLILGIDIDPAPAIQFCEVYGELVHTDLWGPAQTTSLGGAFKSYEAWVARQSPGVRVRKIRSDRGGEYPNRMVSPNDSTGHSSSMREQCS